MAASPADTTDAAPEEAHGAQESGPAASPSHASPSTRRLDEASDTETRTAPGQAAAAADETSAGKGSEEDGTTEERPSADDAAGKDVASPPPLPDEPLPDEQEEDDGWDPMWSDEHQAWYFYNRLTQKTQWDNPRVPTADADAATAAARVAGGYNPAIHGDYDPTAWYATGGAAPETEADADAVDSEAAIAAAAAAAAAVIQSTAPAAFRSSRADAESRQINAYYDVAATGSEYDGRSLKAERSGKKPSKSELKAFKEKRRARKEEKRRAWLRD